MRSRWLFSVCFVSLLHIGGICAECADATKILLVATPPDHAWGSHMYEFDCQVLAKCLNRTSGVEARSIMNWPPEPEALAEVRALVFYSRPVGEIVLDPAHRDTFRQLMQRGVGLVAIHWSTGVGYSKLADDQALRDEYRALLGGWFRRPPCAVTTTRTRLTQVDAAHPICRGWNNFELRDEIYMNVILDQASKSLARVRVQDQDQTVAWTRLRPGGGRSFGITLGHFHDNFARPEFRRLLVNGILWAAHLEPPASGAPVKLNESDLRLPPQPN